MKFLLSLLFLSLPIIAATQNKLVITVSELRDWTFSKEEDRNDRRLANSWNGQSVEYLQKTVGDKFKSKILKWKWYYKEWDRDTLIKRSRSGRDLKFKKSFRPAEFEWIQSIVDFKKPSNKFPSFLRTSHHYLHYYVYIIQGEDSIILHKSKPFDSSTSWHVKTSNGYSYNLRNLKLDLFIYNLLPKKFIARKNLLALPKKKEWWEH